jgi:PAS domain S-box-containing protein
LYANPAVEKLTGWPRQDAVGKQCRAVLGDVCPVEKVISEGSSILHHEGKLETRSGEVRDMQVSISPFRENEAITGAVVVMKDVTDLRESEERYRALVEQTRRETAERAQVEQSLRQYAERLGILHEIEQAIRGVRVPEDIAPAVLQRIGRLVPLTTAAVVTFNFQAGEAMTLARYSTMVRAGPARRGRLSLEGIEDVIDGMRRGKVQVVKDVLSLKSLPALIRVMRDRGIRSFVSAPLIVEGELIGSLGVGADTPGAFTDEHVEVVREVANQLAIVLQQARLREQVERHAAELEQRVADRTRELQTLYEVTAIAGESQDLETVLEVSLGWSLAAVGCLAGAIHLLDETDGTLVEEKTLQLAAWQGMQSHDMSPVDFSAVDMGYLAKRVIELGKPLLTTDMSVDPRVEEAQRARVALSYAGVPMRSRGRVMGGLGVVGKGGQQFRAEEVALLASIADHVAVAVENARLRRDAERTAVIEERERLARELHDSVTQLLYSLSLFAETGRRLAVAGELQDAEDYLNQIGLTAQQALKEMRMLVHELRPPVLEQEGLVGALQQRLDAVERRTGVTANLFVEGEIELPVSVEKVLYHIAQEALNNALRHAMATSVQVCVRSNGDWVELEVVDNGGGFDLDAASDAGGLGLIGIREWAERLGGKLTILSAPGEGTTVKVECRGCFND